MQVSLQKCSEYCKIHTIDVAIETGIISCVHKRKTFMRYEKRSLVKQHFNCGAAARQIRFVN
jgi:hypothetical protein